MLISFHLPCSDRALTPADESLGPPDTWLSVRFRQGEAAAKDERVAGERDWGISSPLPPWFSNPILICIFGRRVFPKTESPAQQPHFHLSSSSWAHWLFSPSLTTSDPGWYWPPAVWNLLYPNIPPLSAYLPSRSSVGICLITMAWLKPYE